MGLSKVVWWKKQNHRARDALLETLRKLCREEFGVKSKIQEGIRMTVPHFVRGSSVDNLQNSVRFDKSADDIIKDPGLFFLPERFVYPQSELGKVRF
jgi:hypothetical protein